MNMRGADVERLGQLANKLEATWAGQIQQLISSIDQAVQESRNNVWLGPDADQFRNQTWPEHKSQLKRAEEALKTAGQTAKRNASAQEQTSSKMA